MKNSTFYLFLDFVSNIYAYEQGTLHRKPPKLAPDSAKLPKLN